MKGVLKKLGERLADEALIEYADMRGYTSFKAGGRADLLIIPADEEELRYVLKTLTGEKVSFFVMGNGSNILVRDEGYRGAIIKIGDAFGKVTVEDDVLKAGSGALMSVVAKAALENSLAGFEFASGIPGSIGGAVFMNAGAYEGQMADIVEQVDLVSKDGSKKYSLLKSDLDLGYRYSILHETGEIVTGVTLKLKKGDKIEIGDKMKELAAKRNSKQPVNYPSAGSFFKRPEGYFAGKLIQDAGLKGLTVGGAQISELHSGFVINKGGATATDIIRLMEIVQNTVMDKFGVWMEPEVRIIGEKNDN